MALTGAGKVIGKRAPDFKLKDHKGGEVVLSQVMGNAPTLLAFYPGDFTPVCTKQLCTYRDRIDDFKKYGVQIFGISSNPVESHAEFAKKYDFPFLLLSDVNKLVAKAYDATSILLLGKVSRAVFILNTSGIVLYRYVEPTTITHRKPEELVAILDDLKNNKLI